jgi:hypothetical protein
VRLSLLRIARRCVVERTWGRAVLLQAWIDAVVQVVQVRINVVTDSGSGSACGAADDCAGSGAGVRSGVQARACACSGSQAS